MNFNIRKFMKTILQIRLLMVALLGTALFQSARAQLNTSYGVGAGGTSVTGSFNSSFGFNAGMSLTSGSMNSNFGAAAGAFTTIGAENANFGFNAGYAMTTGSANSTLGAYSGNGITTGNYNTAAGFFAGSGITTGTYNVAIGKMAAMSGIQGHNGITVVGAEAGNSASIPDYSVLIGYNAGSGYTFPNKSVFLLNNSSQMQNPLLYGYFSTNNNGQAQLGINTTNIAAGHALTVGGSSYMNGLYVSSQNPRVYVNNENQHGISAIEFHNQGQPRFALGQTSYDYFYITRHFSNQWYDQTFAIRKDNGYVGIGVAEPGMPLDVAGRIRSNSPSGGVWLDNNNTAFVGNHDSGEYFGLWSAGVGWNTLFVNKETGYVGMGTLEPLAKLHLVTSPDDESPVIIGPAAGPHLRLGYTTNYAWIRSGGGKPLFINDAGNNTVINRHDGIVAIGTDDLGSLASGFKMAVNGGTYIGDFSAGAAKPFTASYLSNYLLWVEKGIVSENYAIASVPEWGDHVFENDYRLRPLDEVADYIKANKHLPEIPSAEELKEKGMSFNDMSKRLIVKIEELTLYTIRQQKEIEARDAEIHKLQELVTSYQELVKEIEAIKKELPQQFK